MDKAKIYEELKGQIEEFLCENSFEMDGNEYDDRVSHEFELSDGIFADCDLIITGYNHHDRGDYFTPPDDSGEISAEVREVVVYDEEGEELFTETYVNELSTSISY